MPRGYGGVAILWKKELDSLITSLKIGNERIQVLDIYQHLFSNSLNNRPQVLIFLQLRVNMFKTQLLLS
jgi:hypothetical protein